MGTRGVEEVCGKLSADLLIKKEIEKTQIKDWLSELIDHRKEVRPWWLSIILKGYVMEARWDKYWRLGAPVVKEICKSVSIRNEKKRGKNWWFSWEEDKKGKEEKKQRKREGKRKIGWII